MSLRFIRTLALASLLGGCASSAPPPEAAPPASMSSGRAACDEIATRCHAHAEHGGAMSACHQLGHDPKSTNEMCQAKKAECQAACQGAHDHGPTSSPSPATTQPLSREPSVHEH